LAQLEFVCLKTHAPVVFSYHLSVIESPSASVNVIRHCDLNALFTELFTGIGVLNAADVSGLVVKQYHLLTLVIVSFTATFQ
jgi:hypothetical protein